MRFLNTERSLDNAIQLLVRLVAGTFAGLAGAFIGSLINAALVPATQDDNILPGLTRIIIIGATAALAAQIGWMRIAQSRTQTAAVWIASIIIASIGVWIALIIAAAVLDNTDLYMLNRNISGVGLLGGSIASNIPPLIFTANMMRKGQL